MLKPFVSMCYTGLFMLTLIVMLHSMVQLVACLDTSACGISMSYYRRGDGNLFPNPHNISNKQPDPTDTTIRAE